MKTTPHRRRYCRRLGVPVRASEREIKSAYRSLAKQWHPDRNQGDPAAKSRFQEITEAYRALTGEGATRRSAVPSPRSPSRPSRPFRPTVRVPFRLAARGGDLPVRLRRWKACPGCDGEPTILTDHTVSLVPCEECGGCGEVSVIEDRRIEVPAGVADGDQLRIPAVGTSGAKPDSEMLTLEVRVQEHPFFRRDGLDLRARPLLTPVECALGCRLGIPVLQGPDVRVSLPPGTDPGTTFRIPDRGVDAPEGRGDLLVTVDTTAVSPPPPVTSNGRPSSGSSGRPYGRPGPRSGSRAHYRIDSVGADWPDDVRVLAMAAARENLAGAGSAAVALMDGLGALGRPALLLNLHPAAVELDALFGAERAGGLLSAMKGEKAMSEIARWSPDPRFAFLPSGVGPHRDRGTLAGSGEPRSVGGSLERAVKPLLRWPVLHRMAEEIRSRDGIMAVFLPASAGGFALCSGLFDGYLSLGPRAREEQSWWGIRRMARIADLEAGDPFDRSSLSAAGTG